MVSYTENLDFKEIELDGERYWSGRLFGLGWYKLCKCSHRKVNDKEKVKQLERLEVLERL